MNRIVTGSFIFFGISVALFGVVRATGAVMAPLIILTISMLVVRFPLAEMFLDSYHVDAVWWSFPVSSVLSAMLALALLPVRRLAPGAHDAGAAPLARASPLLRIVAPPAGRTICSSRLQE